MFRCFVFLLMYSWCALSRDIPSFVHLCKRRDPNIGKCMTNTTYEIMPHLIKGIPEMDLPSVDPLRFSTMAINTRDNRSSVNMHLELINGTITGIQNLEMKNHTADVDQARFSAVLYLPHVKVEANYVVKGKVLTFEVDGAGRITFNSTDVTADGVWYGSFFTKKGKQHMYIDKVVFSTLSMEKMSVAFDNLFSESPFLTSAFNTAVNDNIDHLEKEVDPIVKEVLGELVRGYFNRVYALFPVDQLYPSD